MMPHTRTGSKGSPLIKNTVLKVVILGDGGVGKSCLLSRFVCNKFDEHSFHTIGVEFLNKDIEVNGNAYTLQIWDTAGQERFRSLRTPFYRGSDICILTFSVDDVDSFKNLEMWQKEFLNYADVKEGVVFPFIVVGNKIDIPEQTREVKSEDSSQWCVEHGELPYLETSAKEAVNVNEAFTLAVQRWSQMESKLDKPYLADSIHLAEGSIDKSCCF